MQQTSNTGAQAQGHSQDETNTDPAALEQDIMRTQEEISETISKIATQLEPQNLSDTLVSRAAANAQRNPLALTLIAGGAIWLAKDKFSQSKPADQLQATHEQDERSHADYLKHMMLVERRAGEDASAYRQRRQAAQASFFSIEQRPGEDEIAFGQRIQVACDQFRQKCGLSDQSASSVRGSVRNASQAAAEKARRLYAHDPITGGLVATAAGAILGTVLPVTRAEEAQLAAAGETVRAKVMEQKERLVARVSS